MYELISELHICACHLESCVPRGVFFGKYGYDQLPGKEWRNPLLAHMASRPKSKALPPTVIPRTLFVCRATNWALKTSQLASAAHQGQRHGFPYRLLVFENPCA